MFSDNDIALATQALNALRAKGMRLVTAESCTGGLLSALLTAVPGASDVVMQGFITYSNTSKTDALGVPPLSLDTFGAVSKEVAETMARGALVHADGDISIAITGVAGPDGGTPDNPVGTVHLASTTFALEDPVHTEEHFDGDRASIRLQTCQRALKMIIDVAEIS